MPDDSCDFNLSAPSGPPHVHYSVTFQTNNAIPGRSGWLWDIWKDGHRLNGGSERTMAEAWQAAGWKMAERLKLDRLPSYIAEAKRPAEKPEEKRDGGTPSWGM